MKRVILLVLGCALALIVMPALAQSQAEVGDVIVLDNSTPSISAQVSLPQNATGVVSLSLNNASVIVTDSSGKTVFQVADGRIHNIELSLVPNAGAQTIQVERLPGVERAAVSINATPELSAIGNGQVVNSNSLTTHQQYALKLDTTKPGGTVQVNIPNTLGVINSTYVGANVTSQVLDNNGTVVATSYGGAIDGMNLVLDGGQYDMTLVGNNLSNTITADVQVMPTTSTFVALQLPAATQAPVAVTQPTAAPTEVVATCDATIAGSSVNLRSGPGTNFNVLGYASQGETYPVGGTNPEHSWILIGLSSGSAWVSRDLVNVIGNCNTLTVYNIP